MKIKILNTIGSLVCGLTVSAMSAAVTVNHNPKLAPQYTGMDMERSDHVAFAGNGYPAYFDFPVWVDSAKNVDVKITYGADANRTVDIYVNAQLSSDEFAFADTGWSRSAEGSEAVVNVRLKKGLNSIRFSAGNNGGPNIYNIAMEDVRPICGPGIKLTQGWGWENNQSCHGNDAVAVTDCAGQSSSVTPLDRMADSETKKLYKNLDRMSKCDKFIFGSEFPLSFAKENNGSNSDVWNSDMKDVAGDHAGVHGLDPHYMMYKNTQERNDHLAAAKSAYDRGGVITYDFHHKGRAPANADPEDNFILDEDNNLKNLMDDYHENLTAFGSSKTCIDREQKRCGFHSNYKYMAHVVEDIEGISNPSHGALENFEESLQRIVDAIEQDGQRFPVVVRMYHEMNGGWFWWGVDAYKAKKADGSQYSHPEMWRILFRHAVDYIRDNTNRVLFAWSPDTAQHYGRDFTRAVADYWPGDNYVDVVGLDYYEPTVKGLINQVGQMTDFAVSKGKPAIIAEMGHRGVSDRFKDYRRDAPEFWNGTVLNAIKNDPANKAQRIAWLQTWLHQQWSKHYIPVKGDESPGSQNHDAFKDFSDFKNDSDTVFLWELDADGNTDNHLIDMYD